MTYAGLATVLCRFLGLIIIGALLLRIGPGVLMSPSGVRMQAILLSSIVLIPGVLLIVASKPLGRLLAAGLD